MEMPAILAAQVLRLVGNWMCLWLWGLALWFFFVSAISNIAPLYTRHNHRQSDLEKDARALHKIDIQKKKIPFAMTWYSYIFPQTALTTATFRIADAFGIRPLEIVGCVMAGLLVAMWVFVVTMMIRAVHQKQILWPEVGEDREEGGFQRPLDVQRVSKTTPDNGQMTGSRNKASRAADTD